MRRLEEILDMPDSREILEQNKNKKAVSTTEKADPIYRNAKELDKIAEALPRVKGLGDVSDSELDELAKKATDAYDDLMDLGMNVESRYASRIFEVASSMLKNAIDAKTAKIDKKLKMIELQLRHQKQNPVKDPEPEGVEKPTGAGVTSDRNSLLEKIKQIKQES
jgi:hypothetical protein